KYAKYRDPQSGSTGTPTVGGRENGTGIHNVLKLLTVMTAGSVGPRYTETTKESKCILVIRLLVWKLPSHWSIPALVRKNSKVLQNYESLLKSTYCLEHWSAMLI